MIIGTLQPNADPRLSTCGSSLNSSPAKAFLVFSLSIPTASSNDMAFRFSDAKTDSLSANFWSSALLAVECERNTTISAKFAFTARRSARQKGEPYNMTPMLYHYRLQSRNVEQYHYQIYWEEPITQRNSVSRSPAKQRHLQNYTAGATEN